MIFIMASGLASNIGGQLASRFLAGFFGLTPLTCAGGSISDLWNSVERVFTFPVFTNAAFIGLVRICNTALVSLIYKWVKRDLKKVQEGGDNCLLDGLDELCKWSYYPVSYFFEAFSSSSADE